MDNLTRNTVFGTVGIFACYNPITAPLFLGGTTIMGAQATISSGSQLVRSMQDPNATTGQKWAYGLDTLMSAGGTALAGYGFSKSVSNFRSYMQAAKCNNAQSATNESYAEQTGVCFVAGTLIAAKDGFKEIQVVKVGDKVYSENPETGEKGFKKVTNVFVKETSELVHVSVGKKEIKTTPTHPFWVEGTGWVAAGELEAGDKVRLGSGAIAEISNIAVEKLDKPIKVYNFEVEDWHTYFVSDLQVLVHNTCEQPIPDKGASKAEFGPMNKGALPDAVANTFRSSTYSKIITQEEITLYRAYGGKAGEVGGYWTRTKPQGPLQATIDSALDQNWGNTATNTSTIKVPKGTTIYEGFAAEQRGLVGGGSQVYIERVDPSWLVK